jgi:undecaprenyl-diphosphatase
MEQLIEWDKALFLYLNSLHAPGLDPVMKVLTGKLFWIPLYAFLLYFLVRHFGKQSWVLLLGIVLTIVVADQVCSSLLKPLVARLRPTHEPTLAGMVHIVAGYRGGTYGFASSHAANTIGIATFFYLVFGRTHKWILLLFAWAALVCYTRIYLGVHYPGDILGGAIVGTLAAWGSFWLTKKIKQYIYPDVLHTE